MQETQFDAWVGKIHWRRDRLPTPVFWPGEFHGLYSPCSCKESNMTEWLSQGPPAQLGLQMPAAPASVWIQPFERPWAGTTQPSPMLRGSRTCPWNEIKGHRKKIGTGWFCEKSTTVQSKGDFVGPPKLNAWWSFPPGATRFKFLLHRQTHVLSSRLLDNQTNRNMHSWKVIHLFSNHSWSWSWIKIAIIT